MCILESDKLYYLIDKGLKLTEHVCIIVNLFRQSQQVSFRVFVFDG